MKPLCVIGAGSWGTTIADMLAKQGRPIRLWAYEAAVADAINSERRNPTYLPGIGLHEGIRATTSLADALDGVDLVVSVSPAQHVRTVLEEARPHMSHETLLISASKGIETASLRTMAEVIEAVLPEDVAARACFISGPSFAREVAAEVPTAVTVASHSQRAAERAQALFQNDYFRVYTSTDVRGVELGGALKNVIALAAGMADGLGLGYNTRAALITRGLAEIARLGVALGANPLTFAGLAGMGDLILTCTGDLSRNRSVGIALGKGRTLQEVLSEMQMVAEGVETARATRELAEQKSIEMPIVTEVHAVLFEGRTPSDAVSNLMLREPKAELWQ